MNSGSRQPVAKTDLIYWASHERKNVSSIFELQVAKEPRRVAIVHGTEKISYAELNARANKLAHYLCKRGIARETLVVIAMERSPELIVCILAVLKAGGAYLPLDPSLPKARLATIFENSSPSIVLTTSSSRKNLPNEGADAICLDSLDLESERCDNPDVSIRPTDLAYVMFTSGSTGQPKGVMVEHRSIVRLVKDTDYADFGSNNVFLQFAPITFDASTFEIWGALLNGSRLAIMPGGLSSLADLGTAIREYGVTTLWLTAGLFHLMVDERLDDLRPLRQLLAGGDVLSVTHVRKVLNNLNCDLINGYGPTENTTFTCTYKIPRDADLSSSIPIGKPIAKTQVFLLDHDLKPVDEGEVGELYIGGEGLARGYLNAEKLTAERFVDNPFSGNSSPMLYRSGDLARVRSDGNIEFLGRMDTQVKIRGFRVELEEIELALTRRPEVREAIVVAKSALAAEKQLIAFVVPEADCRVELSELRCSLLETLPEYMIPRSIISIDAMPLTPNGKVDRAALIEALESEKTSTTSSGEFETNNERSIAKLLEDVLANGPVGSRDNFFDLGANSLQIARFHSRLQTEFGGHVKIVDLFQNPTIRSLARSIESGNSAASGVTAMHDRAARQRAAYAQRRATGNGGN